MKGKEGSIVLLMESPCVSHGFGSYPHPHPFVSLSRKPTVPLLPMGLTVSCQQSGGIVDGCVIM